MDCEHEYHKNMGRNVQMYIILVFYWTSQSRIELQVENESELIHSDN